MARLRDIAITLIFVAVLVPTLVLTSAIGGLSPRHWSGIPLSGMELYAIGIHPRYGDTRPPGMDQVTDQLSESPYQGWIAVIPGPDGHAYIETTRLPVCLLPRLGSVSGATVGVIYGPLAAQAILDERDAVGADNWWQRTDPLGTWVTLTFGFPLPLAVALLVTAVIWAATLRRRRRIALVSQS